MTAPRHPILPSGITVLPGTDVDDAWARFQHLEALHHRHRICNPMTAEDLETLVDILDPRPGEKALDLACGHGALLACLARRAPIEATGVDLSPWALAHAVRHTERVDWWLGDARSVPATANWDVVTCLGAAWIWGGFEATLAALAERTVPGGRVAIGDLRLRTPQDRPELAEAPEAASLTEEEQLDAITRLGLEPLAHVLPDDEAWSAYHDLVIESALEQGLGHLAPQLRDDQQRLRMHLAWTVWVAVTPGSRQPE
jgi:SAM-dependent methyltransferase